MNKIEAVRKAKGMSRYRMAKITGMDYKQLYNYERKGMDPKLSTLRKIAEALGVDVKELI